MTERTSEPGGRFERPCIAAFTTDVRQFTVSEYDALQGSATTSPCGHV
jgi:hypothetical protein